MKITIFGLAGTGKTTAGKLLSESLGLTSKSSGNMFRELAVEKGMSVNELDKASIDNPEFDKWLDSQIEEYGKTHDDFVFESRLAWHFIPDSIKIRLYCDFDERVKRIAGRESKDIETAKKETNERESHIFERYEKYYNLQDIDSPKNFDLNINTTHTSPKRVTEIIIDFIKTKNPAK